MLGLPEHKPKSMHYLPMFCFMVIQYRLFQVQLKSTAHAYLQELSEWQILGQLNFVQVLSGTDKDGRLSRHSYPYLDRKKPILTKITQIGKKAIEQ